MPDPHYQINPDKLLDTIRSLHARISERFPDSGLSAQADTLVRLGERTKDRIAQISKPIWSVRALTFFLIAFLFAGIALIFNSFPPNFSRWTFEQVVELTEAGVNDLILTGLGIFFLVTWESRIKRNRALRALHELRSIAHVIDMHQLTKDPDRLSRDRVDTSHSPKSTLTAFELRRYLDYCAEMLSLTGKIAASYLQNLTDPTAVSTVNEIEALTTGLSNKIWQKIMIIQNMPPDPAPAPASSSILP